MNEISLSTFKISKCHVQRLSLAILASWLLLFSACGVQNELVVMSPTPAQDAETDQAGTASIDSTPTATKHLVTSEPTATPTTLTTLPFSPTLTQTLTIDVPTITSTKTAISMPTPTLSVEELRQRWQTIDAQVEIAMVSSKGCQLPCWWGIEPGDSVTDAEQVFNTINENGWVDSLTQWGELQQTGFFEHNYRNKNGEYLFSYFIVDLVSKLDQVNVIRVFIQPHTNSDPSLEQFNDVNEFLSRDWEQFSVKSMFEAFGQPDLIYLLPRNFADGDNFSYEFNIYYPTLGIVVSYSFDLLSNSQDERTICLNTFNMNSMALFLYDPSTELPSSYIQATYSLWPLSSDLKSEDAQIVAVSDLESRTNMRIDEFVTFVLENADDTNCFTLN